MFTIYTDKSEDFKCKIGVEGTKLSETTARLVIESDGFDILFEGKIDSNGECTVPIKKMKNILSEGDEGKMMLEVIAEDTYFTPWEDEYVVETNKKVTVEVVEKEETIKEDKITVQVIPQNKPSKKVIKQVDNKKEITENTPRKAKNVIKEIDHGKEISKILTKNGISLSNLSENKTKVKKIIKEYTTQNKTKLTTENLLDKIVNNLGF